MEKHGTKTGNDGHKPCSSKALILFMRMRVVLLFAVQEAIQFSACLYRDMRKWVSQTDVWKSSGSEFAATAKGRNAYD